MSGCVEMIWVRREGRVECESESVDKMYVKSKRRMYERDGEGEEGYLQVQR